MTYILKDKVSLLIVGYITISETKKLRKLERDFVCIQTPKETARKILFGKAGDNNANLA